MTTALIYLQSCSWKNRLRFQLKRLKKPKYMVGGLAGAAYLVFSFWVLIMGIAPAAGKLSGEARVVLELGGALGLLAFVVSNWLLISDRAALNFTEAEVAFLFPAPVTRRSLIHYKLAKSQVGVLFLTLLMALFAGRSAGQWGLWMQLLGWWLALSTLDLHKLGASFTRTLLLDRDRFHWRRRYLVVALLAVMGGLVIWWTRKSLPAFTWELLYSPGALADYAREVLNSEPLGWLLLPFRMLLRPVMAADAQAFLYALPPALALLWLHYHWVMQSEASFEEATIEKARQTAQVLAVVKSGNWHMASATKRRLKAPFKLLPSGWPAMALLWKNLIAAESAFQMNRMAISGLVYFLVSYALHIFAPKSGLAIFFAVVPIILGMMLFITAPEMLRVDLRQDLRAADLLKTYPLPGWQLVLGEILAPTVVMTLATYGFIFSLVMIFPDSHHGQAPPFITRLVFGLSAAIFVPAFTMMTILLPNAKALLFPAWTKTGPKGAEGFEAVGQGLVFMLLQALVSALALLFPALAAALIYYAALFWFGPLWSLPLASTAATVVMAAEVFVGIQLVGQMFDRLDISEEMLA